MTCAKWNERYHMDERSDLKDGYLLLLNFIASRYDQHDFPANDQNITLDLSGLASGPLPAWHTRRASGHRKGPFRPTLLHLHGSHRLY